MPRGRAGRHRSSRGARGRGGSRGSSFSVSTPGATDQSSSVGSPTPSNPAPLVPQSATALAGDVFTELLQLIWEQVCMEMTSAAPSAMLSSAPVSHSSILMSSITSGLVVPLSQAAGGLSSSATTCHPSLVVPSSGAPTGEDWLLVLFITPKCQCQGLGLSGICLS